MTEFLIAACLPPMYSNTALSTMNDSQIHHFYKHLYQLQQHRIEEETPQIIFHQCSQLRNFMTSESVGPSDTFPSSDSDNVEHNLTPRSNFEHDLSAILYESPIHGRTSPNLLSSPTPSPPEVATQRTIHAEDMTLPSM